MKKNVVKKVCNLCGEAQAFLYQRGQDGFDVLQCAKCQLVYVYPQPDEKAIKGNYNYNYYQPWLSETRTPLRKRIWEKRLERIKQIIPTGKLLDIGCGEGSFLECAENAGYQVYGTEYSKEGANIAQSRLKNGNVHTGPLKKIPASDSFFDIITLWHVLEHVRNPVETIKQVEFLLRPQGLLVIAVPNAENYFERLAYLCVKRRAYRLFSIKDRELHLFHFTRETLEKLITITNGFEMLNFLPDMGTENWKSKAIDQIAEIFYRISNKFYGRAIQIEARKR